MLLNPVTGIANPMQTGLTDTSQFSAKKCAQAYKFHRSIPGYTPTPLRRLQGLAHQLGVSDIWVKDESYRFGLNAFKALGASYAIAVQILGRKANLHFDSVQKRVTRDHNSKLTFVTATDGNHGRAVAWISEILGVQSVVYMPHGSEQVRIDAIRDHGAQVEVLAGSYDDAVNHAAIQAEKYGWTLIQDTAVENYTSIPLNIMHGYSTLLTESFEQLGAQKPTHVFLQAGVGSMAAAVQAILIEHYGSGAPKVIIVEPRAADCFFTSMSVADGNLHSVNGHLDTNMAGLACGTPSLLAWPILRDHSAHFFRCGDAITESGMRLLASPVNGDKAIISGESGAVTTGLLAELMSNQDLRKLADSLSLGPDSKILLISTEGDTDPINYRRIVDM
jgi:diaminopropionate ammonia-lyase